MLTHLQIRKIDVSLKQHQYVFFRAWCLIYILFKIYCILCLLCIYEYLLSFWKILETVKNVYFNVDFHAWILFLGITLYR